MFLPGLVGDRILLKLKWEVAYKQSLSSWCIFLFCLLYRFLFIPQYVEFVPIWAFKNDLIGMGVSVDCCNMLKKVVLLHTNSLTGISIQEGGCTG
jgi:hypothetical protein